MKTVSRQELAELLLLNPKYLSELVHQGMPKPAKRGVYDLVGCVNWYIKRLRGNAQPEELEAIVNERERLYRAQRIRTELQTETLRGELVHIDDVQAAFLDVVGVLVQGLDALPVRHAKDVQGLNDDAHAIDALKNACRETREQLAEQLETLAERLSAGEQTAETAAEEDGGGMGGRRANGTGARD